MPVQVANGRARWNDADIRDLLAHEARSIQSGSHSRSRAGGSGIPQDAAVSAGVWEAQDDLAEDGGRHQGSDRLFHRCAQACAAVARDFGRLHRKGFSEVARVAVSYGFTKWDIALVIAATASALLY